MNNNLTTTNQNAKLALSKSRSLLNITNRLLSKTVNSDLTKNFQFKPYLIDTLNCSAKSVAVTPDGKTIFSISADNTIKSWDVKSGKHINTLDKQKSVVSSLAITPDGKFIIMGNEKGTIDLCEIKSGKSIRTFKEHPGPIYSLEITSNGKYLLSTSSYDDNDGYHPKYDHGTLKIWDLETGEHIKTIESDGVAIAPNGEYFVSRDFYYSDYYDHPVDTIALRDTKSGKIIDFLEGNIQQHFASVSSLAITPDGIIVSGGGYNQETITVWAGDEDEPHIYEGIVGGVETIKLWSISRAEYTKVLKGHTDSVYSLAVTPDGKNIVSGSKDNTIKIWDIQSGECIITLKGHTDAVNSVITSDGKTIISTSKDGTIKIWDIQSGECNYTIYNIEDGSTITMFSDGSFNASQENIDEFIRVNDTPLSCRKLTKEEIEHFCKVKYEHKVYDNNNLTRDLTDDEIEQMLLIWLYEVECPIEEYGVNDEKEDMKQKEIPFIDIDEDEIPF